MDASGSPSAPTAAVNGVPSPTDNGHGSEKRKRQPRNSACQACATLKMRCVPGPMLGKCERCHRMQRDCEAAVAKPRKRRLTNYDREIMLKSSGTASDTRVADSIDHHVPPVTPQDRDLQPPSLQSQGTALKHPGNGKAKSRATLFASSLGIAKSVGGLIEGLDHACIQKSFAVLRNRLDQFPFITIPTDIDADQMAANRPLTTLATCVVASSARPETQQRLAKAFKISIAQSVLVDGKRNLDLLVGLLVFLTWHQHYMINHQIYQVLCSVAGVAAELGLYREPYRLETDNPEVAHERDRAFVGCYVLCGRLSIIGLHKPNPMRWTENLRLCAESAFRLTKQAAGQGPVAWLELTRNIEEFDEMLRFLRTTDMDASAQSNALIIYAKTAKQRLEALGRRCPELESTPSLKAIMIHIYRRILQGSTMGSLEGSLGINCARSIKEYFNDILSRSSTALHQFSILEWASLLEMLILLARISTLWPPDEGWEAEALKVIIQMDTLLDALAAHVAAASPHDPLVPQHEAQLKWLGDACERIKQRYLRYRRATPPHGARQSESQHGTCGSLKQQEQDQTVVPALAESRFRPVNLEYAASMPKPVPAHIPPKPPNLALFEREVTWDNGVFNDALWDDLMKT